MPITGVPTLSALGGVPTTRTITLNGTTSQIVVSPTGAQDLSADRSWTVSLAQGSANQLLGMTKSGVTNEYKTLLGTTNQVSVSLGTANQITLSTPQDIATASAPSFRGLTITGLQSGSTPSFNVTGGSFLLTQIDSTNTTAPTLAENLLGGSLSAGTYTYQVTFVTADGETEFRNDSAVIAVSSNSSVSLSAISTHSGAARVTARKIYRTPVGNNIPFYNTRYYPMYLVTTINDNTTTTYTDTMSDATLKTQTKRFYSNDTAGAFFLKTEQLSTPLRLMSFNYVIDNNSGQRGEVTFGPNSITAIREDGQIIFNNIQEDTNATVYPSRAIGFTWLISSDSATMGVKELANDQMEYGFYMGDNDTGDFVRFQMALAYNGRQADKNYLEISGNNSSIHSGLQIDGGDLILNGSSLHSMVREATSTTTAATTIYIDNTLPPPATNSLTLTGNSSAYTGTADTTFFVKIVAVGTPTTFKWRQGGDFNDATGYSGNVNITGAAQTLAAGVTITFNQTTGGIANQIYHFRVLAPSRLQVNYSGNHYIQGNLGIGINSPLATLHVNGGTIHKRTAVNDAAYVILATDYLVAYTAISVARNVTPPTGVTGQIFIIKDEAGAAATFNLNFVGTLDGAVNPVLINTNYGVKRIYYNGTNWFSF